MPKITLQKDGVTVSEKRTVNFVQGTGVPITATEDADQANIQFDQSGLAVLAAANTFTIGPQTIETGGAANNGSGRT